MKYGILKEVYSRLWYLEKRQELRKCERIDNRIWEKNKCRNETTEEVRYSGRKRS